MALFGLEEEVFIIDAEKPTLLSLYYLAKLLKKDPRYYYFHTASNFARGKDIKECLMGGVEIATGIHDNTSDLIKDLVQRRKDLVEVCDALIVPLGSLLNMESPTNVCALHIHISEVSDLKKAYNNLAYFLPLLSLLTSNSPAVRGSYFGKSFRIASSYSIGPIKEDWKDRFQDIIFSRRLKTLEVRVFDPTWDIRRISYLIKAIEAIVSQEREYDFNVERYISLRDRSAKSGYDEELRLLYRELSEIYYLPEEYFSSTPSDEVWSFYQRTDLASTYRALDNAYRNGTFSIGETRDIKTNKLKIASGFLGYYLPKLPYTIWKYSKEHGYV